MSQLSDFLDAIWKDTDGYVYIALRTSEGAFKRVFPKWPEQKSIIQDFVLAQTAKGDEVFYSPAIWKDKPSADRKFGKDLFLGSHVLWADLDGNAPESWPPLELTGPITLASDSEPGAANSQPPERHSEGIPPEPSIRVQSSTSDRQHLYWVLDDLITDVEDLENRNRTLALILNADPGGWDATQILRPPDTTNYGYAKPERKGKSYPVKIEYQSNVQYKLDQFQRTKDFRPLVKESLTEIPNLREVLAKHQWADEFWKAFNAPAEYKKRSDQLQALAYYGAESGFSDEEIYSVLLDADDRWEKYKNRTDRHIRLVDIIERARAKYPVGLDQLTFQGLIGKAEEQTEIKTLYNFTEFMAVDIKLEWLFEGLLPQQGYGIIGGPTGIGKSQLALRLGEKIVSGQSWLGWINAVKDKPIKVLIFSLEMSHVELKEFLTVMSNDETFLETGRDRFFIVPIGDMLPLDRPEGKKFFEQKIQEVQPDIVIIDSLSKAMPSFREDDPVLTFNRYVNQVRSKYGTAIVFVHHNRKQQDKKYLSNDLDDLYGSRFLTQDASFVLMLARAKEDRDKILVNTAKVRFSPDDDLRVLTRTPELDFWIDGVSGNDNGQSFGRGPSFGLDGQLGS